jgi:hypothetical protein
MNRVRIIFAEFRFIPLYLNFLEEMYSVQGGRLNRALYFVGVANS